LIEFITEYGIDGLPDYGDTILLQGWDQYFEEVSRILLDATVYSSREILSESNREPSDYFLNQVAKENFQIANEESAALLGLHWDRISGLASGGLAVTWGLSQTLLDQIEKAVIQAEEEGWSKSQVEQEITNLSGFGADRAKQLSQNALSFVDGKSSRRVASMTGATEKFSETVGDDHVCAECEENEADGWIPINEQFSGSGTEDTPHHPNCRCSVSYRWQEAAVTAV